MSAVKDAADALVASLAALDSGVDALIAFAQANGAPPDLQAAIDEIVSAKASADAEAAKVAAAIPPPPAKPAS